MYCLSLIKLYSACVKQNAAVKTASDAFSLLAKEALSNLVGQRPSLLIVNFELVIKLFLVWNIYFAFFLPVVDCTFYNSTINSNGRVNLHSITLEPAQFWSLSEQRLRGNKAQTSSLCYVAGFQTPLMKMCSAKEV